LLSFSFSIKLVLASGSEIYECEWLGWGKLLRIQSCFGTPKCNPCSSNTFLMQPFRCKMATFQFCGSLTSHWRQIWWRGLCLDHGRPDTS